MATSPDRKLFRVSEREIDLLGTSLSLHTEEGEIDQWIMDHFIWRDPKPVSAEIETLIRRDRKRKKEHLIDYILVSPRVFANLFIAGKISLSQMEEASEDETEQSITVTGVEFCGGKFTVKTMPEDKALKMLGLKKWGWFATVDKNGKVV